MNLVDEFKKLGPKNEKKIRSPRDFLCRSITGFLTLVQLLFHMREFPNKVVLICAKNQEENEKVSGGRRRRGGREK